MSYETQIISIFVSSPGDVSADRKIVLEEMQAWNQRNAKDRGCFLTALTWEDLVSPDIAKTSQDVINVEVGDDYDVFLGLMWGRFGTPTGNTESGTKEEFERAISRKESGQALRISFFFRKSDIPFDEIDPEQLAMVKQFKNDIAQRGAYYRQYSDERELASALTMLFDKIASERERYTEKAGDTTDQHQRYQQVNTQDNQQETDHIDPDAGLLDLQDDLQKHADQLGVSLASWAAEFVKLNEEVKATTSKLTALSQFGQPDRNAVRSEIECITLNLSKFYQFASSEVDNVEDDIEGIYRSLNGIVNLANEFDFDKDRKAQLITEFSSLGQTIVESEIMLTQYIDTMSSLPRIEKKFNLARNSVVIVHKQLRKKLRDFSDQLTKISDELDAK